MASARLLDPIRIRGVAVKNRLYRAPLLEVAGNGPDAPRILERELVPSAASGVGLVFQGACLVTAEGGRSAPGLTRVHDAAFVATLRSVTDAVHAHGARIFLQLGHGALQTMETWHKEYRARHPGLRTLAVSEPPLWMRAIAAARLLDLSSVHVMTTEEVRGLAAAFGRAAKHARDAGYDGIHLAGANGSVFQQFWSPAFNRRTDEFGGPTLEDRAAFLRLVVEEIRRQAGADVPIAAKVPAETGAPFFARRHLTLEAGVQIARLAEDAGVDAVAPVQVSILRDASVARGAYPGLAWSDARFREGYAAAFGGPARARLYAALNRAWAVKYRFRSVWNEPFFSRVKQGVSIPVLAEGGIRRRAEMDRLLAEGRADMVGMARPFYAEPLVGVRLLADPGAAALCGSCNNCTIPQVTGAPGVCRTPAVMAKRAEMQRAGAYGRRAP